MMECRNFMVRRDDICVGLLVDNNNNAKQRIYFTLEDNYKKAKDLLNEKEYSFDDGSDLHISNVHQLGVLLKYLGFNEELSYEDVLKIDEIFGYGWKFDNASLFGLYRSSRFNKVSYNSIDHRYDKFRIYTLEEDGPIPYVLFDIVWKLSNPWNINTGSEVDLSRIEEERKLAKKINYQK